MYGIPDVIDQSLLENKELIQACFGSHDLILHFEHDATVSITSSIGKSGPNGSVENFPDLRRAALFVVGLLGRKVKSMQRVDSRTLLLQFDPELCLYIFDDSDQFESFIIKYGDQVIVV